MSDICCPTVAKMWITKLYHSGIFLTLCYKNSHSSHSLSITAFISENQSHGSFNLYVIMFPAGSISVLMKMSLLIIYNFLKG